MEVLVRAQDETSKPAIIYRLFLLSSTATSSLSTTMFRLHKLGYFIMEVSINDIPVLEEEVECCINNQKVKHLIYLKLRFPGYLILFLWLALGSVAGFKRSGGVRKNHSYSPSHSGKSYIFFILSGLHFLHVIVGLMFLGIYSNFPETFDSYFQFISQDLYFLIQVLYWHFVEIVWLYIFLILYSYF